MQLATSVGVTSARPCVAKCVANNAEDTAVPLTQLSSDPPAHWLTEGGLPPKHVHTHTLLRIQQHNGHNRTLNYSLCQINMFPSSPDRLRAGGQAKWGKMSQGGGGEGRGGKDGGCRRNATPHFNPSPC